MRHILIILSFLLLSSPVIGQETGVLYQYETSSGLVWKTFGNEKLQPKYEYVTFQICYKLLRFGGQDGKDFTHNSHIPF